ncbi:MAG: hypothetical protein JNL21_31650 [Myxococcales bacterium]|nr:hypothetical protein [Myxococcales bacterium]
MTRAFSAPRGLLFLAPLVAFAACQHEPQETEEIGEARAALCSYDWDCPPEATCEDGYCLVGTGNPKTCQSGDGCSSGFCVDGYCCNTACSGQCEACNLPASLGVCSPVTGAPHGARPACATDGSACGGTCDGQSRFSCAYPGGATQCRDASCQNGVAAFNAFCNGSGVCPPSGTQDCGAYQCGNAICLGDCSIDADCDPGHFCSAGICQAQVGLGQTCFFDAQCASGQCVDGVCCNSACGGQCEACDVAGHVGQCTPVIGDPHGARPDCASDGSACGGVCNGSSSACHYPAQETSCRQASCTDGVATEAASCNGAGACPAVSEIDCAPFVCEGAHCDGPCVADSDCEVTEYCAAGMCLPQKDIGADCQAQGQCSSGHCVDGFCCDTGCSGQCEACSLPGSEGICSAVAGAPVGARPACASDGSSCGGVCDGSGTAGCAYPAAETECRGASCADGVAIAAGQCAGTGSCPAEVVVPCGGFACDGEACKSSCATDDDCVAGQRCVAGACIPLVENGAACAEDAACLSGACADGVCCDRACDGQCEACDVAGAEGRCSPVLGEPHGGRPACAGTGMCAGSCDGANVEACVFPGADIECASASCADGAARAASTCDGEGSCDESPSEACASQTCEGPVCAPTCEQGGVSCPPEPEQLPETVPPVDAAVVAPVYEPESCSMSPVGSSTPHAGWIAVAALGLARLLRHKRTAASSSTTCS